MLHSSYKLEVLSLFLFVLGGIWYSLGLERPSASYNWIKCTICGNAGYMVQEHPKPAARHERMRVKMEQSLQQMEIELEEETKRGSN